MPSKLVSAFRLVPVSSSYLVEDQYFDKCGGVGATLLVVSSWDENTRALYEYDAEEDDVAADALPGF